MAENELAKNLQALFLEVLRLANLWKRHANFIPKHKFAPSRQTILQILASDGDRTVPQIARAICTSRQNIQVLVNGLLNEGLVEVTNNPAHKRSSLVHLKDQSRPLVTTVIQDERGHLESTLVSLNESEIIAACELLHKIGQRLAKTPTNDRPASKPQTGRPAKSPLRSQTDRSTTSTVWDEPITEISQLPVSLL